MKKLLMLSVVLAVAFSVGICLASGTKQLPVDGKAAFEKKCSLCHSAQKALDHSATPEKWEAIILRMQKKASGRISDAEADAILDYLVGLGK